MTESWLVGRNWKVTNMGKIKQNNMKNNHDHIVDHEPEKHVMIFLPNHPPLSSPHSNVVSQSQLPSPKPLLIKVALHHTDTIFPARR